MRKRLLVLLLLILLILTGCMVTDIQGRWYCCQQGQESHLLITDQWIVETVYSSSGEEIQKVCRYQLANGVLILYHPHNKQQQRMTCYLSGSTLVIGGMRFEREEEPK